MQEIPPDQSLIEYPSKFPIKVMGLNADGFVHAITLIAEQFDPAFDATTVELLRELCEEVGIAYNLRPISEADVTSADEILLSSATKEVLPVTSLDGQPVGHGALRGKPGPIYARLYEAYQRAKAMQTV